MATERDTIVVVLDILAGMSYYHDGTELGDIYGELYQHIAQYLLADEQQSQQTPAERAVAFLNAFYKLPEADRQVLRVLLREVLLPAE